MSDLESGLYEIAAFLENDIRAILLEKGHNVTGELVRSIKNTVSKGSDSYFIDGEMLIYGGAIIKGRQKGAKGIPIRALVEYLQNRGFTQSVKEITGIAFAVQSKIKRDGIKPDDFIGEVFDKREGRIDNKLSQIVEKSLDISLTNMINNAKQFV